MSRAGPPCRRVMRSGNDALVALPGRSLPPTWLLEQRSLIVSLAATKATREGSNGPSSQLHTAPPPTWITKYPPRNGRVWSLSSRDVVLAEGVVGDRYRRGARARHAEHRVHRRDGLGLTSGARATLRGGTVLGCRCLPYRVGR